MGRMRRLKIKGEEAWYHLISRTVGGEFYFNDVEKEKLVNIIKYFSKIYFVKVIGYCVMSNHFHLVIKSELPSSYTKQDILKRLNMLYPKRKDFSDEEIKKHREKFSDISEYMKSIKLTFSRWFNKLHDRKGYLWGDRFKSVLIESGEALVNTIAYIDLNPIRAKIVKRPEDYRWSSIGYRIQFGNKDKFLSFDGIFNYTEKIEIRKYLSILYQIGMEERQGKGKILLNEKSKREYKVSSVLKNRIRYFSDGVVIGSKEFILNYYNIAGKLIKKKERKAHKSSISENIYSFRCLVN
ncbi:transposase [Deferribacterales bacterium Es71-Z0220]|uniref:transposase n=1 Tax=Deferrivibrio essentukiensis TaxID=2880922 RepID=UPI001F60B03B|nr:transposase [Deferrivibrio essentukiensis]MCB4203764.1 transposase [Deferrivibrio essentukiensis]